jgi:type IV pilus assembly protein PilW
MRLRRAGPSRVFGADGFSLIELLVATTLGTIVTAGAFAAMARARSNWAAADIENRLHERAQYAFATLETELQMAGYFAGSAPAASGLVLPPSATACGAQVIARVDRAIEASDANYPFECKAQGQGYQAGTDVLLLRRVSTHAALPGTGRIQWLSCLATDCTSTLIWPPESLPLADAPAQSERRDLIVRIFYVSRSADGDAGTPALRVKSLSAISGAPSFIDTEVMPGVDDLQITLEPESGAPRSVQVTLGVRADAADQRAGEPLRRLTITRQFALRNVASAS